jgi:transposase InsO family protein
MDTIDFGELFAFTAIDIFSKEVDIFLAPALTSEYGSKFLHQSMSRRFGGHVKLLQTDGGPEFKAEFKSKLSLFCSHHRVARPYHKNEQSYIESFNRTVRKECLGWQNYRLKDLPDCQKMVELFLERYHYHRPHMGLRMMTPLRKEEECRISTEN